MIIRIKQNQKKNKNIIKNIFFCHFIFYFLYLGLAEGSENMVHQTHHLNLQHFSAHSQSDKTIRDASHTSQKFLKMYFGKSTSYSYAAQNVFFVKDT